MMNMVVEAKNDVLRIRLAMIWVSDHAIVALEHLPCPDRAVDMHHAGQIPLPALAIRVVGVADPAQQEPGRREQVGKGCCGEVESHARSVRWGWPVSIGLIRAW
jgi:hypothetical protein